MNYRKLLMYVSVAIVPALLIDINWVNPNVVNLGIVVIPLIAAAWVMASNEGNSR